MRGKKIGKENHETFTDKKPRHLLGHFDLSTT